MSASEYCEFLLVGLTSSSHISFDRWDAFSLVVRSNLSVKEKMQVLYGSFVRNMEFFGHSIFKISKVEAESMSPL